MSVENPQNTNSEEIFVKPCNGESLQMNGLTNGHAEMNGSSSHDKSSKHKSSSKDKYRDRDRDKDRNKSSKSSSSKDYSKSSSSSNKDKNRDKERDRERDKNRDKERDKDRDKNRDKDRSSDKEKYKSSSSSTHKSSTKDKDRERDKDRNRDKDKERSSNKEKSSNDKDRTSSKDEKPKESSDKDRSKDHKTSSKDKERSSDKDKYRSDKDKDRHKSSSSKDKHSSSSKSKDKDREREKDKDRSRDTKDRDKDRKDRDKDREKRRDKEKSSKSSTDIENSTIKLENGYSNNAAEQIMINNCNFSGINDIYVKEENNIQNHNHYVEDKLPQNNINHEVINASQTSSCDYSMSQFREDESAFDHKLEIDESQQNFENVSQDQNNFENGGNDYGYGNGNGNGNVKSEYNDEKNVSLSKRKAHGYDEDDEEDLPLISRKKVKHEIKEEEESEEDIPLAARKKIKKEDSEEDIPLASRKNKSAVGKKKKRGVIDDDEDFDEKPQKKKVKAVAQTKTTIKTENESPTKGRKKKGEEEPEDVWRWWEEEKRDDSIKWKFLEHKGPLFPPDYEKLPSNVRFYYDGKAMNLSTETEEVCCFYAKMLNHDYVTKKVFNDNFFKDWRKTMTQHEKEIIKDLGKCNFKEINDYFTAQSEKNKNRTKQEKQALKEQNEAIIKEYGFCTIDGHKEKIGNFRLEPPGLFRGRGEHPKMGMVKKRLRPEDIIINCSKNSNAPKPPHGHRWKEVKHDNTVTWLASWIENVQGQGKYIMLNPSSKIKGEKDFQKYETARRLDKHIDKIRNTYRDEWKSKEMKIRQRAVALYFIDKLALRAGNEKDEDQADTVGCCSLRVEHVELHKELDGKENVVVFDFLGKDSIRYYNAIPVEKRVFKNLELFKENKKEGDELFDRLNTSILNEHLRDLMEGLTAKVFRTYNASITLQRQLDLLTEEGTTIPEKLLAYNRANRAVAILCNHQRSVPKSHEKSMENLKGKINNKRQAIDDAEAEYRELKRDAKRGSVKEKINADKKLKQLERLKEQLKKLELQETDRDENKTIALGTSKLNYLDPRISVAWCKKYDVPIEKIFNKTQRDKFRWAIHMADENYRF